jgi:hypothetical protein
VVPLSTIDCRLSIVDMGNAPSGSRQARLGSSSNRDVTLGDGALIDNDLFHLFRRESLPNPEESSDEDSEPLRLSTYVYSCATTNHGGQNPSHLVCERPHIVNYGEVTLTLAEYLDIMTGDDRACGSCKRQACSHKRVLLTAMVDVVISVFDVPDFMSDAALRVEAGKDKADVGLWRESTWLEGERPMWWGHSVKDRLSVAGLLRLIVAGKLKDSLSMCRPGRKKGVKFDVRHGDRVVRCVSTVAPISSSHDRKNIDGEYAWVKDHISKFGEAIEQMHALVDGETADEEQWRYLPPFDCQKLDSVKNALDELDVDSLVQDMKRMDFRSWDRLNWSFASLFDCEEEKQLEGEEDRDAEVYEGGLMRLVFSYRQDSTMASTMAKEAGNKSREATSQLCDFLDLSNRTKFLWDGEQWRYLFGEEPYSSIIASFLSSGIYQTFSEGHCQRKQELSAESKLETCKIVIDDLVFESHWEVCFHAVREAWIPGGHGAFVLSLMNSKPWAPLGGKSNACFAKSVCGKYVIKQISDTELESFLKLAADYFTYIQARAAIKGTRLAKLFGVYTITIDQKRTHFLVTENILSGISIGGGASQNKGCIVYDLKGVWGRWRPAGTVEQNLVHFDEDLLHITKTDPIFLSEGDLISLRTILEDDVQFLAGANVMDYSLLCVIRNDENGKQMRIGIIDYLRDFSLDKKLESSFKKGLVGEEMTTVVEPVKYGKRFVDSLMGYFSGVPE